MSLQKKLAANRLAGLAVAARLTVAGGLAPEPCCSAQLGRPQSWMPSL